MSFLCKSLILYYFCEKNQNMIIDKDDIDYILERTKKIGKSKIREIFTPHIPISNINSLKGRRLEVQKLFEILTTPGQQALLYGERGVGKSSLAQATAYELSRTCDMQLFLKSCVKSDNFATIFQHPLRFVNVDIYNTRKSEKGTLGLMTTIASLARENSNESMGEAEKSLSPAFVFDKVKDLKCLFLIDEFDSIRDIEEKAKIAEFIKLLSDYNSKFKILIVGIADSARDLTEGHPSLTRCMKEIRLRRMSTSELADIIKFGQKKAKLMFTSSAISKIVYVSSGYPYFTHLLALKAAEDAIVDERDIISIKNIIDATQRAAEDSEETLKNIYETSLMHRNRDLYERVLLSASTCREEGFSTSDLKNKYYNIYKEHLNNTMLTSILKNIISDDNSNIIKRLYKGRYRFSDPRMPSFIKISRAYLVED